LVVEDVAVVVDGVVDADEVDVRTR